MKDITKEALEEMEAKLSMSQQYGHAPKNFGKSDEKFEQYISSKRSILPCTDDGNPLYGFYNGRHVHASLLFGDFCARMPKKMLGQFIRGTREGRFKFYLYYIDCDTYEYIVDTKIDRMGNLIETTPLGV